jgi:hypothetical protein
LIANPVMMVCLAFLNPKISVNTSFKIYTNGNKITAVGRITLPNINTFDAMMLDTNKHATYKETTIVNTLSFFILSPSEKRCA